MAESWTTLSVLEWTTGRFARAGFSSPRLDAQVLLAHVLGCDRVSLYTTFDRPLQSPELEQYRGLIQRRLSGEPVAYLVGVQEFWSLPFCVDARVLIPRRDSETMIDVVLDNVVDRGRAVRIADIATGSGALAIALASELPSAHVVATDISHEVLALARDNAQRNGVHERMSFYCGDLTAALPNGSRFDIVVANLPYVPSAALETLEPEVQCEPALALDGGVDGLDLIRRLLADIGGFVEQGGLLALEHGFDQGAAVRELLAESGGFMKIQTRPDLAGQPRISFASRG